MDHRMKQKSAKTAARDRRYARQRRLFLLTHPNCEIMWDENCSMQATQVDHIVNRSHLNDEQMLDERNWNSACAHCHHMKTVNPEIAEERGLAAKSWDFDEVTRSAETNPPA